MGKQLQITPIYSRNDLVEMLDAEYTMLVSHVEDLSEEQLKWKPHPKAHCVLDVLWHLAYQPEKPPRPQTKSEALTRLRTWYEARRADAQNPAFLTESMTWWNKEAINGRGYLAGFVVRHIAYHYGQIIALLQAMGVEEGKFYHE